MFNNKSHKKILIVLVLAVFAIFALYYFLFEDIKTKNEHTSVLLGDLSFQLNKEEYVISTSKAMQAISPDLLRINNSIVSAIGHVEFIESLESIARNNGLFMEIESLTLEDNPKLKNNEITTLKVKATTNGTWSGTYKFLEQIESLPFKIKVSKFSFANTTNQFDISGKKAVSSKWQSSFEIRVLKYK